MDLILPYSKFVCWQMITRLIKAILYINVKSSCTLETNIVYQQYINLKNVKGTVQLK